MAKNIYNQSFWYFKPDSSLPFGMHKGKTLTDIVRSDYKYLSYCLTKLDHFILSRPVLRFLQKNTGLVLSSEAIEILGQKADKADASLLKGVYNGLENSSKTGSAFKNIHAKGTHNILNYEDFFKFIEFSDFSKITDTNYAWFSKFFEKVIGEDKTELNGVWIIDSLRARAAKNNGQDISIDGKSTSSKILAHKSHLSFYLKDEEFSSLVENYYTKIKPSDFLEKRNKLREEADYEELLDPASHNDTNHDEDAWDALTDGQYGDYDDRFD